jgi:hypothetical protein
LRRLPCTHGREKPLPAPNSDVSPGRFVRGLCARR